MHEDYLVAKHIRIKVSGDSTTYNFIKEIVHSHKQCRKIINTYNIYKIFEKGTKSYISFLRRRVLIQVPRKQ